MLFWLLATAAVAAVVVAVLGAVWFGGGVRTRGAHIDWAAISALAAVGGVVATAGAMAVLSFALNELASQARDERITRKPYLRVDVGFKEEQCNQPGFRLPVGDRYFTAEDFKITDRLNDLGDVRAGDDEDSHLLCLWVSNQQSASVGIAYQITVLLTISWDWVRPALDATPDLSKTRTFEVGFVYVEPCHTTAIELLPIKQGLAIFAAIVVDVTYQDVFGRTVLVDRHGALSLQYDGLTGQVRNEREFELGR